MTTVTTKDGVAVFYKDWGSKDAQPIVFHHGWPLSADDWDTQMLGEFKGSSQHGLCELFGGTGPEPRPVFASPGSFAACC